MKVSLVVVTHHSSSRLPEASSSFRREAAAAGLEAEVVVVEQSEDGGELAAAKALEPEICVAAPNRGYAAGINAGVTRSRGDVLLLANPDIVLLPGALSAMLEALSSGVDIVGPQFELGGCLFPPADEQTPFHELRRSRASTSRRAWERHVRLEVQRGLRVWHGPATVAVPNLSGALIVTRRHSFERVGAWNEDYFLYFEETDWLRRAHRLDMRCAIATRARVIHRWGHAADPGADSSAVHFERSRARYYRDHFGHAGRLVDSRSADSAALKLEPPLWDPSRAPRREDGDVRLLSPSAMGSHAASIEAANDDPEACAARIVSETGRRAPYFHLICDARGAVRGPWLVPPPR